MLPYKELKKLYKNANRSYAKRYRDPRTPKRPYKIIDKDFKKKKKNQAFSRTTKFNSKSIA
jgi:hypothetical protein